MRRPIFVRELTEAERQQLEAGLRSSDAFVLRRSQVILASARGEWARIIARNLGCDDQTVRNIIKKFERSGLNSYRKVLHVPILFIPLWMLHGVEKLKDILHQSPRDFGKPRSLMDAGLGR